MSVRCLLVLAALALTGCASGGASSSPPPATQVRCLADPSERDTRPLVFLFCVQSP